MNTTVNNLYLNSVNDKALTSNLFTVANSVIINPVDKIHINQIIWLYFPPTQQRSFFRNLYPVYSFLCTLSCLHTELTIVALAQIEVALEYSDYCNAGAVFECIAGTVLYSERFQIERFSITPSILTSSTTVY